jgi:retron-type reverse transcriptase
MSLVPGRAGCKEVEDLKRAGALFDQISSFETLFAAATEARRGKRFRAEVSRFHHDLESNLLGLRRTLVAEEYRPGRYRAFRIRDPKPRLISAAPYRDRVVHHAVCRVIEPIFDPTFIHDCYANRLGKGTHASLDRCSELTGRYRYVLKCDCVRITGRAGSATQRSRHRS